MTSISRMFFFALSTTVVVSSVTSAEAANRRTWVAGTGADTGGCTMAAPCRTFQFAQSKTSDGGTINVLTAGEYGAFTITQSLNIVADGVEAYIFAIATHGITVNAAGAVVSLRGLTIDVMPGVNYFGIQFGAGSILRVENTTIRGGLRGIAFSPGSAGQLHVLNTTITNSTSDGLAITSAGGPVSADIEALRVRSTGGNGILMSGQIKAAIRDSVFASNAAGILVGGSAMSPTNVMLSRVHVVNNSGIGIQAQGATVRLGDSVVSGNGTGLSAVNGGVIASYKTSQVNGNTTDGTATGTAVPFK